MEEQTGVNRKHPIGLYNINNFLPLPISFAVIGEPEQFLDQQSVLLV